MFLYAGGIFLLTMLIYVFSLGNDFVFWDDPLLVTDNPIVYGLSIQNIHAAFTTFDPDLYVPLTTISFQVNYAIAGLDPFIYHLTNLLLHAGSAILTGAVAFRLSRTKTVALIAALLFAVHPINVEAVAWVSSRKDLLSSFFFLLSLWSYLRFRDLSDKRWYGLSIVGFLLGLLSKVSVLPLPFILILSDLYTKRSINKRSLLLTVPFFFLSILFGIVSVFGKMGGQQTMFAKMLLGMKAIVFSLWHLVWPMQYSVVYPFTGDVSLMRMDILLPLLAVFILSVVTLIYRKKLPAVFFAWWWFLFLIAPSFLTAEKGRDVISVLYLTSDRYVYLATIGIFFAAALLLNHLRNNYQIFTIALVVILLFLAGWQALVWRNTETLLTHSLSLYPGVAIAHNNLGAYYDSIGKTDLAIAEYLAAAHSGVGTSDAWFNLGVVALRQKQSADAIDAFTRAVELRPDYALAQLNLGALLLDAGQIQESVNHLLAAQKLEPGNISVYLNLGMALEKGNDPVDAIRAYERVLQLDPENAFAKSRFEFLKREQ